MGPQLPLQKRPKIENERQAIKAATYSSSFAYSSSNKVAVQTHMAIILQESIKLHSIRECGKWLTGWQGFGKIRTSSVTFFSLILEKRVYYNRK
jgi:hypothetical protein